MTPVARRALSALTSAALLAGLFLGTPAPVRAAETVYVGHQINEYALGSDCADPDYWTDGDWTGGGEYDSDDDAMQDAIDYAASGDTIYVCSGHYDFDTDLQIFDTGMNLTIVGDGVGETVLDGTDSTRLINANPAGDADAGGTLTLKDLSIEDARTVSVFDNGGAVNADGLSLIRVSISGSDNAYNGGALYAEGNVTIVDSTFTDNDSSSYGAVVYAWNTARTVSISNSVFDGNAAGGGGGAILATTVTVTGSTFTDNNAVIDGGAILATTVAVTGSTFTDNAAQSGGAIYANFTATVTSSTFTNNSANSDGGAINAEFVIATSSTFTGNSADYGGAISGYDTATVTNSTFMKNSAESSGGAVITYNGIIARSRFTRNTAGGHGGAVALWDQDDLQQVRGNTFSGNTASVGGAITLRSCETTYTRSQVRSVERANRFSGNRATQQRRTSNIERWEDGCGG